MDQRSARTRARLQLCALDLFAARGFDATTVNDIAAAAGVSPMTFFRHFPTKEAVLLDDPYDPVMAEAVRSQPDTLPPLERVRRGLLTAWSALPEPADDAVRARVAIVAAHGGLRAKAIENTARTEDILVQALVSTGVSRLDARVAAGACLGALMAALFDWGEGDAGDTLGARVTRALGQLELRGERTTAGLGEAGDR